MHHGFVRVSPVFVINGQPPEVLKPGEGALDNPSSWHGDKSVRAFVSPEYDFQVTAQQSPDRVPDSLAPVTSVRRNPSQPQSVNHYVLLPSLYLFLSVYTTLTINMMGGPDAP